MAGLAIYRLAHCTGKVAWCGSAAAARFLPVLTNRWQFKAADTDRSGRIEFSEYTGVLRAAGLGEADIGPENVRLMFQQVSKIGSTLPCAVLLFKLPAWQVSQELSAACVSRLDQNT